LFAQSLLKREREREKESVRITLSPEKPKTLADEVDSVCWWLRRATGGWETEEQFESMIKNESALGTPNSA